MWQQKQKTTKKYIYIVRGLAFSLYNYCFDNTRAKQKPTTGPGLQLLAIVGHVYVECIHVSCIHVYLITASWNALLPSAHKFYYARLVFPLGLCDKKGRSDDNKQEQFTQGLSCKHDTKVGFGCIVKTSLYKFNSSANTHCTDRLYIDQGSYLALSVDLCS